MHPVAFRLGSFELPAYGLLMAAGALAGALIFAFLARRAGFDRSHAFEVAIESVLVAMLAAKAAGAWALGVRSVAAFVGSGGIWYAGLAAGAAFFAWRSRALGTTVLQAFDLAAPGVALGHAVGRLGCLLAGCCWGKPCALPWAVTFTDSRARELTGVPLDVPLHPVQLYEAMGEMLLASLLVVRVLWGRPRIDGMTAMLYLVGYGLLRIALETLRDDPRGSVGPFSPSQAAAACVVVGAAVTLALLVRTSARAPA